MGFIRAKTEDIPTKGDTHPVRRRDTRERKRSTCQQSRINNTQKMRSQQRRGEQIGKCMVGMERSNLNDL